MNFFSALSIAPKKISFIGLLGAGKTTAASALLNIMNRGGGRYELISTDEEVISRMRKPADPVILEFKKNSGISLSETVFTSDSPTATFIEKYGEPKFRDLEAIIVTDLIEKSTPNQFFDLGGKVPLREELSLKLKSLGIVLVYLEVNANTIEAHLSLNDAWNTRGIFKLAEEKGDGWRAAASKQRAERVEKYRAIADIIIQADDKTPEEIVQETIKQVQILEIARQNSQTVSLFPK